MAQSPKRSQQRGERRSEDKRPRRGDGDDVRVGLSRVFTFGDDAALGRFTGVGEVADTHRLRPARVRIIDLDTTDGALAAHGAALRCITGKQLSEWEVLLLGTGKLYRVQLPMDDADAPAMDPGEADADETVDVPERVLDLVRVYLRDRPLQRIRVLDARRERHVLLDEEERVVGHVYDDRLRVEQERTHGNLTEPADAAAWRQVMLEVTAPSPTSAPQQAQALLGSLASAAEAPGTESAPYPAARGDVQHVAGTDGSPEAGEDDLGSVLARAMQAEVRTLTSWDPLVRLDVEDSVHRMRVAARTLRSVLQVYKPLFDENARSEVNHILRDLGRLLAAARDAEVVRDQVDQRIAELPHSVDGPTAELVDERTAQRLRETKTEEYRDAHREAVTALRRGEYLEQLDRIDGFARRAPLDDSVSKKQLADPRSALALLADAQAASIIELARRAREEEDAEQRNHLLHEARKEAKKLRYALRAVSSATNLKLGKRLTKMQNAAEKLQNSLGAHRDSLMFQRHLVETAHVAHAEGEDTFGYGVLYTPEARVQKKALKKAFRRVKTLKKRARTA